MILLWSVVAHTVCSVECSILELLYSPHHAYCDVHITSALHMYYKFTKYVPQVHCNFTIKCCTCVLQVLYICTMPVLQCLQSYYICTTPALQVYNLWTTRALQVHYFCTTPALQVLHVYYKCYTYITSVTPTLHCCSVTGEPHSGPLVRHLSQESMASMNSVSSACSGTSQLSSNTDTDSAKKKKKKNWVSRTIPNKIINN